MLRILFRFCVCVLIQKILVCAGSHGCQESKGACEEEECAQILNTSWQALRLLVHRSEEFWLVFKFHLEII